MEIGKTLGGAQGSVGCREEKIGGRFIDGGEGFGIYRHAILQRLFNISVCDGNGEP
jgi:hypothetical protein